MLFSRKLGCLFTCMAHSFASSQFPFGINFCSVNLVFQKVFVKDNFPHYPPIRVSAGRLDNHRKWRRMHGRHRMFQPGQIDDMPFYNPNVFMTEIPRIPLEPSSILAQIIHFKSRGYTYFLE